MSSFEFVFSLLGLLLGFTLVEVLSGLVKTTKMWRTRSGEVRKAARIGWITPLLALFILLDVTSYWDNVWHLRDAIPVGPDTLFLGLIIGGGYYYAASMIFPEDAEKWPNLDEWFWLHRRQVLGPLIAINFIWVCIYLGMGAYGRMTAIGYAYQLIYFVGMLVPFFARKSGWVVAALLINILMYGYFGIGTAIARLG